MWVVQAVLPGTSAETGAGPWWSDAAPAVPDWSAIASDGAAPDGSVALGDPLAWPPGAPWWSAGPGPGSVILTAGTMQAPVAMAAAADQADRSGSLPDLPGIALLLGGLLVLAGWRRARRRAP